MPPDDSADDSVVARVVSKSDHAKDLMSGTVKWCIVVVRKGVFAYTRNLKV